MIDFVNLTMDIIIEDHAFRWNLWKRRELKDGTWLYAGHVRGMKFFYYPATGRLNISGKIIQLMYDSLVLNPDDVYGADMPQFVEDVNQGINSLFWNTEIDIRQFRVRRIDYCFNVKTAHVGEYIAVMNEAFRRADNGSKTNHTLKCGLDGSAYVKTKGDYKKNERRNYVLNFYDKTARLRKQKQDGMRIPEDDWEYAKDVLRLEVQCGFAVVHQLCAEFKMENCFGNLLAWKVALYAEAEIYRRVFRHTCNADFYTYAAAKAIVPAGTKAAQVLLSSSRGANIHDEDYGIRKILAYDVCPFAFLPKKGGIDVLENPIKQICKKLTEFGIEI